jgi:GH25 family lysozyme M1 (1,4-beta-N-acetylmuramidase)
MNFKLGKLGCDISTYQDISTTTRTIDFNIMKQAGAEFVYIRAGQSSWLDADWEVNVTNAAKSGILWGSYWFYDSRTSPQAQASLWRQALGTRKPPLGLVVDLEESYGGIYKGERFWKEFIVLAENIFPGTKVFIYTANWWWSRQTVADPAFFARYPLWVAGYLPRVEDVVLPTPWRYSQAHLWQFTASGDGAKYGVESPAIDLNYWNGNIDFNTYFNLGSTEKVKLVKLEVEIDGKLYSYPSIQTEG